MPENQTIAENVVIAWNKINNPLYKSILVSVSGGANSDIVVDIVHKVDKDRKCKYVFFDTGLEFRATKEHLNYLEQRYGIEILRIRPKKPIPLACKEYGQPFLNKKVSCFIKRLQQHNFDFANGDRPFKELMEEYPNCKSALAWWCEENETDLFFISRNKWLKEFLIQNPPWFKISEMCCDTAKKRPAHKIKHDLKCDLSITGVRKFEGGMRQIAYKSCFRAGEKYDEYMPVFWYRDDDKREYEEHFNIKHSKCYEEYGMRRTGCTGCPFGRLLDKELEILETYEPNLHKAAMNVFKDSYEYTMMYKEFVKKMDAEKAKEGFKQINIFELLNDGSSIH